MIPMILLCKHSDVLKIYFCYKTGTTLSKMETKEKCKSLLRNILENFINPHLKKHICIICDLGLNFYNEVVNLLILMKWSSTCTFMVIHWYQTISVLVCFTCINLNTCKYIYKYYSEESVEVALTAIENQVQLLRREIRGQKSVQDLQKTIDQLQKKLSTEKTAKEAALKDKEAALTR